MPNHTTAKRTKSSPAGRKPRELEKNLRNLRKQEEDLKRKVHTLECSIVAQPVRAQERRLRNWNTLPPPDDFVPARHAAKLPRVRQEMLRQARAKQAVLSLFLVVLLITVAVWFCHQLRMLHLMD